MAIDKIARGSVTYPLPSQPRQRDVVSLGSLIATSYAGGLSS
ncbi:hypothetical protein [Saccharopolyspora spinosa]